MPTERPQKCHSTAVTPGQIAEEVKTQAEGDSQEQITAAAPKCGADKNDYEREE